VTAAATLAALTETTATWDLRDVLDAAVTAEGGTLVLTQDGRALTLTVEPTVAWDVAPAETGRAIDSPNPGVTRITATLAATTRFTFAVRQPSIARGLEKNAAYAKR